MARFHINKNGVPAPCKAKQGNCPLGGEGSHYNSQEEAQKAIDKINEAEHGIMPGVLAEELEEEETTHVSLDCAYYSGNRVIESARCGSCRQEVYEDDTHCSSCNLKLDWDDEMESEYGNFLSMW